LPSSGPATKPSSDIDMSMTTLLISPSLNCHDERRLVPPTRERWGRSGRWQDDSSTTGPPRRRPALVSAAASNVSFWFSWRLAMCCAVNACYACAFRHNCPCHRSARRK
jgi:hypothetical protein